MGNVSIQVQRHLGTAGGVTQCWEQDKNGLRELCVLLHIWVSLIKQNAVWGPSARELILTSLQSLRLSQSPPIAVGDSVLYCLSTASPCSTRTRLSLAAQWDLQGDVLQLWKGLQGHLVCAKSVSVRGIVPEGSDCPCCLPALPLGTVDLSMDHWAPSAGGCQVLPSRYLL